MDLLSDSDEGEAQDEEDEAATMHGEISPVCFLIHCLLCLVMAALDIFNRQD